MRGKVQVASLGDILGFEKRLEFDAFNVFEAGIPKQGTCMRGKSVVYGFPNPPYPC